MICKISRDANDYVDGWITRQPEIKEESITEWLLDYFDQHSNLLKYYQFNRHEEGTYSGADWDWWILLNNGCFKLRIQAKKVKAGTNHYNAITHSNKNGYQIDLLLNSSSRYNFYPLYALYGKQEGVERCKKPPKPISLHICSAQEIYDLIFGSARQRIESSDLLGLTIPLECLFCCPLVRDMDEVGPRRLFEHYFKTPPRKINEVNMNYDIKSDQGFEKQVPEIISVLYNLKEYNDNSSRIIREYRNTYPSSNALSIVKFDMEI